MKAYKGSLDRPFCVEDINHFPVLGQEKYDGIRCIFNNGVAQSASGKPLPCEWLQNLAQIVHLPLDGEIVHDDGYNAAESWTMSRDSKYNEEVKFIAFDIVYDEADFETRYHALIRQCPTYLPVISIAPTETLYSAFEVNNYIRAKLEHNKAEGVIIRQPFTYYKHGRSTATKQECCAIKPFHDFEAVIIGFEPLKTNLNPLETNEFGLAKRSHAAKNKQVLEILGSFVCRRLSDNAVFKVGTGFDGAQRIWYWLDRESLLNKTIVCKSLRFGEKDAPRSPVFKGFRNPLDLAAE